METKCVIIDNYDSFTYNLVHLIKELGADVTVVRNNQFSLEELAAFDRIVLSPGPGIPSEAGQLLDVIRRYAGVKPILGVCLGHQAIGEVFGAKLENLSDVFHGVTTEARQLVNTPLFAGLPEHFPVGRYHSWVVAKTSFPDCLEMIAESNEEMIMALRHRTHNVYGIQFHPESVLTPDGKRIMENWLHI
ncbi:anthranilate synthase component II [Prevotella fusca]|uniref:anthranilate synthase component II n=1 Tax=Prevotella fusca TaxID=589436 RepID=UPI003FA0D5EF